MDIALPGTEIHMFFQLVLTFSSSLAARKQRVP